MKSEGLCPDWDKIFEFNYLHNINTRLSFNHITEYNNIHFNI